jgi:hypothetical protein
MNNAARLLAAAAMLSPLVFGACSMPNNYEEPSSSSSPKVPPPWMEVRDYEPEKPVVVENAKDLFGDLPRADFTQEITTKDATSGTFSLLEWDTPPKNQGSRPWCTAFAQVTVMENMIRHGFGEIVDLSEIHHFRNYNQYDCYASIKASQSYKIIPEASWPYNAGGPVSGYKEHGLAKITGYRSLTKMSQVKDAIRANHPVHIGLDINGSWNAPGKNGRLSSGGGGGGGHAITIVGFYEDSTYSGGGYFLIKNSWGTKWGDMGYGRVPYDYCNYGWCVLLETLGVEYQGKVWDGSTVPPPPPAGDEPTASDIDVVTHKNPSQANKFTLSLKEKKAGALSQVTKVVYNVHETFGTYATWTVEDPKDGFKIPFEYTTYFKGRWTTNGAAVYLKSGKILNLAGSIVQWYYVD